MFVSELVVWVVSTRTFVNRYVYLLDYNTDPPRFDSANLHRLQIIYAEDSMKKKCLYDLIMAMPPSRTLVFVNTKQQADFLDDFLYNMGLPSTSIHSDRTQREREDAM